MRAVPDSLSRTHISTHAHASRYIITYATDAVLGGSLQAEARAAYNLKGFARIRTTEEILAELDAPVPVPAPAALAPGGKTALLVIDVQVGMRGANVACLSARSWSNAAYSCIPNTPQHTTPNDKVLLR